MEKSFKTKLVENSMVWMSFFSETVWLMTKYFTKNWKGTHNKILMDEFSDISVKLMIRKTEFLGNVLDESSKTCQ